MASHQCENSKYNLIAVYFPRIRISFLCVCSVIKAKKRNVHTQTMSVRHVFRYCLYIWHVYIYVIYMTYICYRHDIYILSTWHIYIIYMAYICYLLGISIYIIRFLKFDWIDGSHIISENGIYCSM